MSYLFFESLCYFCVEDLTWLGNWWWVVAISTLHNGWTRKISWMIQLLQTRKQQSYKDVEVLQ